MLNDQKLTLEELLEEFPKASNRIDEIYNLILRQNTPQVPQEERIYILPEAAKYLKMADSTLRLYIKQGDITGSRLGKRWLFQQADLDNFLERFLVPSVHDLQQGSHV